MTIEDQIRTQAEALAATIAAAPVAVQADLLNIARAALHRVSPTQTMPVDCVRWVPIERVVQNQYNPNSVARTELGLLLRSIEADGFTQPVVTVLDPELGQYVVVDGFHRYWVLKTNISLQTRTGGRLPIVVIQKSMAERMASTVRHNRARGKHSMQGMANLVFQMLAEGLTDAEVCNELGLEGEELVRLKHITGFSKLFANAEYHRAWETRRQIRTRLAYDARVASGAPK